MIKNGYYYPNLIWEHKLHKDEKTGEYKGDCAYLFIEGNRRAGKSVGVGIYALKDYFKYGYQTALVRRYLKDFEDKKKQAMENFWKKAWFTCLKYGYIEGLEEHKLSFDGHIAYIDDKIFSYPVALNLYNDYKNNMFENVHTIIYDEFVTEQATRLKDEVFAMFNIYDTIARSREDALQTTSVIFISNVISNANDFHAELGIDKELRSDTKKLIRPQYGYMVEIVNNEVAAAEIENSVIAKVMGKSETGRRYLGYSQGNEGKDDDSFIDSKGLKGKSYYMCNFTFDKKIYGLRYFPESGKFYFSDTDIDKSFPQNYACTKDDHTMNTTLITQILRQSLKKYQIYYASGLLWFNSQRAKKVFLELFRYL